MGRANPFQWSRRAATTRRDDATEPESIGLQELIARGAVVERLAQAGRHEDARAACVSVVDSLWRLLCDDPTRPEVNAHLAAQLHNLGLCLGKLKRYDEAVEVLESSVVLFTTLHDDEADKWAGYLAGAQQSLAGALAEVERWPRALDLSREAVALLRTVPVPVPAAATDGSPHQLVVALRLFAHVRAWANAELDEALEALTEALTLQMAALTSEPHTSYLQEIYITELVQSELLQKLERVDAATRVAYAAGRAGPPASSPDE